MNLVCSIENCETVFGQDNVKFYAFPTIENEDAEKVKLHETRIKAWLNAINAYDMPEEDIKNLKICNRHFKTGAPAHLEDVNHPDWYPTVDCGYNPILYNLNSTKPDISKLCLTCATDTNELHSIDREIDISELLQMNLNVSIKDIYMECTSLQASNEYVPKQICTKCLSELVQMYYFLNKSVTAYECFVKYFKKSLPPRSINNDTENDEIYSESNEMSDDIEEMDDIDSPDNTIIEITDHDYLLPKNSEKSNDENSKLLKIQRDYKNQDIIFSCTKCSQKFYILSSVEEHLKQHDDVDCYICYCEKDFSTHKDFQEHLKIHRKTMEKRDSFMKKHRKIIIDKNGFKNIHYSCNDCGIIFVTVTKLQNHIKQHHYKKPQVIEKKIETKQVETASIKTIPTILSKSKVMKIKPSSSSTCAMCFKIFNTKKALQEHDCKPYCKGCELGFESKTDFQTHIKTYHTRGLYHCSECSKVFAKSYDLTIHKRTHEKK